MFAPGENQTPSSLYRDPDAEFLSFPSNYCGERRVDNEDRHVPVSYSDIAKWESRHVSWRVARSVPNLMFKLKKTQVRDRVNLVVRRRKGSKITAGQIKADIDEGLFAMPCALRFAMLRQVRTAPIFLSLSAADMQWKEPLRALAKLQMKGDLSDEEIDKLSWHERCGLLQKDPRTFFRSTRKSLLGQSYKVLALGRLRDYFYRVEFQQ